MVHIELLGSRVNVGHCCIVNEYDKPGAALVAVVQALEGNVARLIYLSKNVSKRRDGAHALASYESIVPVNVFGVRIYCDPSEKHYWVVDSGESNASYPDGSPRSWQDAYSNKPGKDALFCMQADEAALELAVSAAGSLLGGSVHS